MEPGGVTKRGRYSLAFLLGALFLLCLPLFSSSALAKTSGDVLDLGTFSGGGVGAMGVSTQTLSGWGSNIDGMIGDGTTTQRNSPVSINGGSGGWSQVKIDSFHALAIKDGKLYSWGRNDYGATGLGTTSGNTLSPALVDGGSTGWTDVAPGGYFSLAIRNGQLYSWGFNGYGQLGNGTTSDNLTPALTAGGSSGWTDISTGNGWALGIRSGQLYSWGRDTTDYQLGLGAGRNCPMNAQYQIICPSANFTPSLLDGGSTGWTDSSAASAGGFAIRNGQLYGWGKGGRVGDGTTTARSTPVLINSNTTWSAVDAGNAHALAISSGQIYGWGGNFLGAVGNGTSGNQITSPTLLDGGSAGWSKVSGGGANSGAIRNGQLYFWGDNQYGQIGDGTTTGRLTPTLIAGGSTGWKEVSSDYTAHAIRDTDSTPPTASFTSVPASPTNASALTYTLTFSENVTGVAAGDFSNAASSNAATGCSFAPGADSGSTRTVTVTGCSAGNLELRFAANGAADEAGNAGPTSVVTASSVAIDRTAPTASWTSVPSSPTNASSLTYTLSFSESVTGVAGWNGTSNQDFSNAGTATGCRFNPGGDSGSTRTVTVTNCSDGTLRPSFAANGATDAAGNTGPVSAATAASGSDVVIDTAIPATPSITAQPSNPSNSTSASFSFSGEANATFRCSVDDSVYANATSCTSPRSYSGLSAGSHAFRVWQIDQAGNVSASPASYTWTIDTTAPTAPSISANPTNPSNATSASFSFSGEANATFRCSVNDSVYANATSCTSPETRTVSAGSNTFRVWQIDQAGNVSAGPASYTWTVDTIAPVAPTITTKPASLIQVTAATFVFTGETDATFECKIDTGSWESCTSPKSYTSLSDSAHTFSVKQTDLAGNTSEAVSYTWNIDTEAPAAPTISTKPDNPTTSASASFAFQGEEGADYQCKLDTGSWESCTSPKSYSNLSDGSHTFSLRQTDAAANTSTATDYTWTIDSSAPEAPSITAGPASPIKETSASFEFTGEAGATYECQLNDGAWEACTSPKLYSTLTDGAYTFRVRASDSLGNTSAAAERSFSVDTTPPPVPVITAKPNKKTSDATARFAFTHDGTAQCKLDEGAWTPCTSPKSYTGLAPGAHTFSLRALDSLGNISEIALYSWIAETSATSLEGETDIAADVSIASAIQIDTSASALQDSISEGDLEGLDTVSEDSPLAMTQDLDLRSNAIWTADLFTTPLTASNGASITLNDTDSSGDPNINNAYQGADVSATGGVDWSVNAGTYEGTATVTASNTY